MRRLWTDQTGSPKAIQQMPAVRWLYVRNVRVQANPWETGTAAPAIDRLAPENRLGTQRRILQLFFPSGHGRRYRRLLASLRDPRCGHRSGEGVLSVQGVRLSLVSQQEPKETAGSRARDVPPLLQRLSSRAQGGLRATRRDDLPDRAASQGQDREGHQPLRTGHPQPHPPERRGRSGQGIPSVLPQGQGR